MCCAYTQMTPRRSAVIGAAIRPALRKASPMAYSADPMFPFKRCISVSRNLRVGPRSKDIHYNLTKMWTTQLVTSVRDQNHFTQYSRTELVLYFQTFLSRKPPAKINYKNFIIVIMPIPVAARSKAFVCGRSLTWITGSNPAGYMDVLIL
jgi:hypothetical protein